MSRSTRAGTYRVGALAHLFIGLSLLCACASDHPRLDPGGSDDDIVTLGPETIYPVAAVVPDSISGGEFVFPQGGSGTLKVARILASATPTPDDAEGFFVEYAGEDRMHYREARRPDTRLALWILGRPDCSTSTPLSEHGDWLAIMPVDTLSDPVVFELTQPGYPPEGEVAAAPGSGAGSILSVTPRLAPRPLNSYYIMRKHIPRNGALATNLGVIVALARWNMNDLIGAIQPGSPLRQTVESRYRDTHALEGWTGLASGVSAYNAFRWWGRHTIREVRPYFQWVAIGTTRATESTIAHECGHYLTHLMVGDDVFTQLEAQRQQSHDFALPNPGRPMLEEYAQFADFFKNGNVGGKHQVEDPVRALRKAKPGLDPAIVDWPSLEGYAAGLLARLMSSSGSVQGLSGSAEDIPVYGLGAADVFEFLGDGRPVTVDDLRYVIMNARQSRADALPVVLERTGWTYGLTGVIKDAQGKKIAGALVQGVCTVASEGGREYKTPPTPVTTDAAGVYTLPRAFPETGSIRVTVNSVSQDFPAYVAASTPTNVKAHMPDLTFAPPSPLLTQLGRTAYVDIAFEGEIHFSDGTVNYALSVTTFASDAQPPQWNGTTCTQAYNTGTATEGNTVDLRAVFSPDGRKITLLDVMVERRWSSIINRRTVRLTNIAVNDTNDDEVFYYREGSTLESELTITELEQRAGRADRTISSINWSSTATPPNITVRFAQPAPPRTSLEVARRGPGGVRAGGP